MTEVSTPQKASKETDESGSTILGAISALLAVFFFYGGVQRMIWSLSWGIDEYVLYGLTYIILGSIATGGAVYGLSSKRTGAKFLSTGTALIGGIFWLAAGYFWIQGFFLERASTDIFYALSFGLAGIVLYAIAFISERAFTKRGIIEDGSIIDTQDSNQGEEIAERIEQRGDEIADNIEQFGENFDEKMATTTRDLVGRIPWSKLVVVGALLWIAMFPLANYENALVVVMLLGWVTIPVAIYFDSKPIRKATEGRTWWWVFLLGSLIPLFAVISGLGWLLWKRRLS